MAASTITRDTWTNDTGTAANPNLDGTVLNNSVLQNHIYARIDAMFAGAGSYATFTLGGLFASEAFGTHLFSAGGVGQNRVTVRNTTAGTGNYGEVNVQGDGSSVTVVRHLSTTFTSDGFNQASGGTLEATGTGGLSLGATNASGVLRLRASTNTIVTMAVDGVVTVTAGAYGTGAKTGSRVFIGRNTSGSGAAALLVMEALDGTDYYLWVDATGDLRIGTSPPEEDGTPSDTSGTVVGTQS